MKKLLFALGAISLTAVASTSVVACSSGVNINGKITVTPPALTAAGTATNGAYLDATGAGSVRQAVEDAFAASTDATVKKGVWGTDYTVTVEKSGDAPAAGPLEFTIKGKGSLSGTVTFTCTVS